MKNKKTWIIGAIVAIAITITGCKANDTIREVVEKTYTVVTECNKAVDVVETKITGSEIWEEVNVYFNSLSDALNAVERTLVKVAPYVNANLTTVSSVDFSIATLDAATEDLITSID